MQKAKRLIELMMLINQKQQFTARDLAEACGVSLRTIQRDLRDLEELGVPLYAEFGPKGGYRLLKEKLLPPLTFMENEAVAMFFAYQSLHNYASIPFGEEAVSALSKFYSVLPPNAKRTIDRLKDCIQFWVPQREQEAPFLQPLLEAAVELRAITIRYDSAQGENERDIVPLGLYAHNGYWYCPAYCFRRQAYRLFRADYIRSLVPRESLEPEMRRQMKKLITLEQWFLPPVRQHTVPLRVELTRLGVRKCEADPWVDKGITRHPDGSGTIDTSIGEGEIEYYAERIFGLGTDALVKEPPELVDFIRDKLEQLRSRYGSDET
ncbi:YafY family protein [Paenibacillus thiaminolyticus]|uniref:helix-turn-helix transcriptional regulator n=1 Tax=Paenibacillus thiaminolyticus TaxID=49283 RepID=UPI0035A5C567